MNQYLSLSLSPTLTLRFAAGCVLSVAVSSVFAQGAARNDAASGYPNRIVTMIAPYAPGAATDTEGRLFANQLSKQLGQQYVVDFKPGAGTSIGQGIVARAAPDGYTLLLMSATFPLFPLVFKDLPFDPMKDLAPISLMSKRSALLLVHPSLPANNMKEFVAYAKANPDKVNFATAGPGGLQHLTGLWLASLANIKMTYIHYKGTGSLMPDMLAGRSHMTPTTFSTGMPLVKSGKLKALGVASLERNKSVPDWPTVEEQGFKDFEYTTWLGVLAPAKTPPAIINKLSSELNKVTKAPEVVKTLGDSTTLIGSTPEAFRKHIMSEHERWKKLVAENNITFELND